MVSYPFPGVKRNDLLYRRLTDIAPKRTFCAIGDGLFSAPATSTLTVANITVANISGAAA